MTKLGPTGGSNGPSVLFVHGMWGGAWVWEGYLKFFAARDYSCHGLDLRGHHGSRPVRRLGRVSINDYVADAREVAAEIGNPILVGHSMGGLVVQKLAELLDPPAVVAITPAPPRGTLALSGIGLGLAALRHSPAIVLGRAMTPSRGEAVRFALNRLPPDEQDRVLRNLVPASGRVALDIALAGLPVDADRVDCPMLFVSATDDRITPAGMVRRVASRYGADLREYTGHAHMIILEPGWERVAGDIAEWLDGVGHEEVRSGE